MVSEYFKTEMLHNFRVSIYMVLRVNPLLLELKLRILKHIMLNVIENVIRQSVIL
jgi:hypothetical protein